MEVFDDKQAHLRWLVQRELSRLETFGRPWLYGILSSRFLAPGVFISILVEFGLYFTLGRSGGAQRLGPALLMAGLLGGLALWSLVLLDRQQADRDTLLRLAVGEPMAERSFERIDLTGTPLTGIDATDSSFRNTRLMGVDLSGANLANSSFAGSMAGYADFAGSQMSRAQSSHGEFAYATFAEADLSSADFTFADLRNADLSGADLRNADFSGADLRGADLRRAITLGTRFEGAISSTTTLWPESFSGQSNRSVRGVDQVSESGQMIDLRSNKQVLGGVAAVVMLVFGLSMGKAFNSGAFHGEDRPTVDTPDGSTEVMGQSFERVSYLVDGTAAIVEVRLTNESNGIEQFEVIPPFDRLLSVPSGTDVELVAEVVGNGSASCIIEDASGVLSEAIVQGPGSRAVCAATTR